MNIQAMLKQAQSLQRDMLNIKKEIDAMSFTGESSLVKVTVDGTKKVTKVDIANKDSIDKDDIEMLEDMILIALNDAFAKVDAETEKKMGKFSNIPGLFQ